MQRFTQIKKTYQTQLPKLKIKQILNYAITIILSVMSRNNHQIPKSNVNDNDSSFFSKCQILHTHYSPIFNKKKEKFITPRYLIRFTLRQVLQLWLRNAGESADRLDHRYSRYCLT